MRMTFPSLYSNQASKTDKQLLHNAVVQYEDRGLPIAERNTEHSGPAFKPGFAGRTSGFSRWPTHMACPAQAPQRRVVSALFSTFKLLYQS